MAADEFLNLPLGRPAIETRRCGKDGRGRKQIRHGKDRDGRRYPADKDDSAHGRSSAYDASAPLHFRATIPDFRWRDRHCDIADAIGPGHEIALENKGEFSRFELIFGNSQVASRIVRSYVPAHLPKDAIYCQEEI